MMAGLLSAGEGGGEQASNVTPEEQAQYDEFVNNAYRIFYSEKTFPEFMARMRAAAEQDPVEGLAATTVKVVVRVEESARRNGKDISDDVVFHAGVEIMESLADTAAKAGIHEYDAKEVEAASLRAMDMYRVTAGQMGLIDPEQAKRRFSELQQADKAGQLDNILPKEAIDKYGAIGQKAMAQSENPDEGAEPASEQAADPNEMQERRGMMPQGRR